MKRRAISVIFALLAPVHLAGSAPIRDSAPVGTYPKVCKHGLYQQPKGGPFAAMVFCDDAVGSHLGVVCYAPGSQCDERPWSLDNRFWQDTAWANDVTAFAWDPSGRCLYVSTDEIYGAGDVFVLDLVKRTSVALQLHLKGRIVANGRYSSTLTRVDLDKHRLEYTVEYFDESRQKPASETNWIELGKCGKE
jgi:hypothetical protein